MYFVATPAFGETADATEYMEESQGGSGEPVAAPQPEEEEIHEPEVEEVKVDPVETVVSQYWWESGDLGGGPVKTGESCNLGQTK